MTLNTYRPEISTANTALAGLMGRRYESANVSMTYSEVYSSVSPKLAKAYAMFYKILTGNDIADDTVLFTVNSADGAFKRFYGPTICKSTDGKSLVLLLGSESIPLNLVKGTLKDIYVPEEWDFGIKLAKEKIGEYDEIVLKVSLFHEAKEQMLVFPIGVRLHLEEDEATGKLKEPQFDELETVFSRSTTKLLPFIGDVPNLSNFDGPLVKLSQLDENSVYIIVGYRETKPGGRTTFILQGLPSDVDQGYSKDEEYVVFDPEVGFEVWANTALQNVLMGKPEISEDKPAELIIRGMRTSKQGRTVVDCALILTPTEIDPEKLEAELDFDFD
jgi:hypothetical protein